jgi:hypothetical protein
MAKRYHRGNQNPFVEEEQTIQWPKEKVQKDKQRSTKHTHKTKDRVTRIRQKRSLFDHYIVYPSLIDSFCVSLLTSSNFSDVICTYVLMAVYWLHRTHVHVNNRMFVACFHVTVYVTMTIYLQRLSSKCVCHSDPSCRC